SQSHSPAAFDRGASGTLQYAGQQATVPVPALAPINGRTSPSSTSLTDRLGARDPYNLHPHEGGAPAVRSNRRTTSTGRSFPAVVKKP
ncbi:hypothetical protein NL465_29130, partial [Klebsiella pneumoniae]|nr:hypothetical protein [Klebsiella pneumoniae]